MPFNSLISFVQIGVFNDNVAIFFFISFFISQKKTHLPVYVVGAQMNQAVAHYQTWGNCYSNCNVIVMNYIFKVMESNL